MYPRRCVDHDLGGVVSRPSMGHARKRDERRCDHGCKDLSRTCLSSLSRLMSLFRNVHVRLPGVCTGCCNECPVPRLDRSTPSEWDCNRDANSEESKSLTSVSTYSGGEKVYCLEKFDFCVEN